MNSFVMVGAFVAVVTGPTWKRFYVASVPAAVSLPFKSNLLIDSLLL